MSFSPSVVHDHHQFNPTLFQDALAGLSQSPKTLPCKYFYDEIGSQLFDSICDLEEYYPTRTEMKIMRDNVEEMSAMLGPNILLIEYGSGSCTKTRLLLDNLQAPAAYIPIDISGEHLLKSASVLELAYPQVEILPVCADYCSPIDLPAARRAARQRLVYFPGSTIGNFHPEEARAFLANIRELVGDDGALMIGVDLRKDEKILVRAYDDSEGVTAAFNMNILRRLNGECHADVQLDHFRHQARYNRKRGRVEMHLVSLMSQTIHLGEYAIEFAERESIHTENSYKYTIEGFAELAASAGFRQQRVWTDDRQFFSVQYLQAN